MKIICTQENLKTGLHLVGKAVSINTSLPILNNLLLKTENGMLKISATNLEIGITTEVRCKIETEGGVTASCKTLTELVGAMPSKNITLETDKGDLKLETDNYHTRIKTLPTEDYPIIPEVDSKDLIFIPAKEFKNALSQVVFAASTNHTQPEISGVLISIEPEKLRVVATDRYRLAEKKIIIGQKNSVNSEIIIPQKTANELMRVIGNNDGEVVVGVSNTQASFVYNNTKIVTRLIDGQYPPYQQIIPTQFKTVLGINKNELASALKAAGIFSQNSNSVNIRYDTEKSKIVLSSESGEVGKNTIELDGSLEGESGEMIINHHYILDYLASVDTERVNMKIVDVNSPALIVGEGDGGYLYLVMPIKS